MTCVKPFRKTNMREEKDNIKLDTDGRRIVIVISKNYLILATFVMCKALQKHKYERRERHLTL